MNLLAIQDPTLVEKTSLTRKLTLGSVTRPYPVYRVRLDLLFYNDQNDRIATWITQYKNDTNNVAFSELDQAAYNKVIEGFIIDSNPAAIEKTKNNIAIVNQREPGVVLADGRVIDGNRRFTCLRLLHEENPEVNFFETVILDATVESDKKQIKMLELAIQHGEEQRVDYNQIDLAIGAYQDIVETKLLTIDEYVSSTNEPISEVKRRIEVAALILDFLDFMGVPKQYHIAREMQVFSMFYELVPLLRRCETEDAKRQLKTSVFNNTMMCSFADQRKYIRNVKSMMDSGLYSSYMKTQAKIGEEIAEKKTEYNITNKKQLDQFVNDNQDLAEDLQISMDRSLLKSKKAQARSKPSQMVNKSISMLMDIDTGIIGKLSDTEKDKLHTQLQKLTTAVSTIQETIQDEPTAEIMPEQPAAAQARPVPNKVKRLFVSQTRPDSPFVYCRNQNLSITNLGFTLEFAMFKYSQQQGDSADCIAYFITEAGDELCPLQEFHVESGGIAKVGFTLKANASSEKCCFLVIKSPKDKFDEAQQIIRFEIKMLFSTGFDF